MLWLGLATALPLGTAVAATMEGKHANGESAAGGGSQRSVLCTPVATTLAGSAGAWRASWTGLADVVRERPGTVQRRHGLDLVTAEVDQWAGVPI